MTNQVSENILYTGIDDLDIDLFESQYTVPEGMSYNSWVIIDQKIAIMDTADARKGQEWLHNIDETLKGRQPAYLICHHMEPDHSALVAQAMELYPAMTLVCSQKASQMMLNFFHGADLKDRTLNIKEGDTLELGSHTLHFIAAPMVHWPEVMMSYEQKTGHARHAATISTSAANTVHKCSQFSKKQPNWTYRLFAHCTVLYLLTRKCKMPSVSMTHGAATKQKPMACW